MTIKCDWATVHFREGEAMKETFEFLFHPTPDKWKLKGPSEALTTLIWKEGVFWFVEEGKTLCSRSFKELVSRNVPIFPSRSATLSTEPPTPSEKVIDTEPLVETGSTLTQASSLESPPEAPPMTTDEEWTRLNEAFSEIRDQASEESPPPPASSEDPSPQEQPDSSPQPKRSKNRRAEFLSGQTCTWTWHDKQVTINLRTKAQARYGLLRKTFGSTDFLCCDPRAKLPVGVMNCQANVDYELVKKSEVESTGKAPSSQSAFSMVTFMTEFGKRENVRANSSDSPERRLATLRFLGIYGDVRLLIEGREINWSDIKTGDVILVERITDASIWVKEGNSSEAKEFKYSSKDPIASSRMIQGYWPNQSLFRRFERAPPSTWILGETLWILPEQQWHLCVKLGDTMRRIAFISEEQFYRQVENWA
jgi:hypothetical protein